ncbi:hypothetical protein CLV30_107221 [Haloactinopolyspora alba]|uniref:Uncharacterized protein n=1 Tax=Haloactinopolyspora alba TaxID=648780 RepID=A0A2P8E2N4_9ACTN|nr:hypothetical protein [Haloactinopolyspora alba]PSL03740.1 hypothetical protein CLV30_107221 [Haloactinopolyspora alba]
MRLGRRTIGAITGAAATLVCAGSAYVRWYDGRAPHELPITQLVRAGEDGVASGYWESVAAPLAVLGAVGVLGGLVRSRLLLGLAWLTGVATIALWWIMRLIGQATDQAPPDATLDYGRWLCVGGLVLLLIGIAVMGPRREEVEAPLSVFDDEPPE